MATATNDAPINHGVDTTSVFLGSSALYSGQFNSTFTRRMRSSTSSPEGCDECCLECCCGLCALGGAIICVRQMPRARRVQILWVWVTLLALTGGLVCSLGIFGQYPQPVAPTDMRTADKKLSPYFCDSVTLDSNTDISAYVFDSKPKIDTHNLQQYEERDTAYILYNDFKYWKFYLLRGSVITALSCADVSTELFVIKGWHNFEQWKKNNFCVDCAMDNRFITWDCSGSVLDNYTMTAIDSDDYFFVYADSIDDTWVSVDFRLKRTLYDVSTATSTCIDSMQCSFDLDLHKKQVVVYHVSDDFTDTDLTVGSQCNSRIWFYMLAFCACPATLGCILSVVLYQCCKEPSARRLTQIRPPRRVLSRYPNERTPLLWANRPTATVPQPPKYDDIVRDGNTEPPTYEQATS